MTLHPVVSLHEGWLSLDEQEERLRVAHAKVTARLHDQAEADAALRKQHDDAVNAAIAAGTVMPTTPPPPPSEVPGLLSAASWDHQQERRALAERRKEWLTANADQLLGRCDDRAAELAAEVSRLVDGFTAGEGERVRGLAAIAAEARQLRTTYREVQSLVGPASVSPDSDDLTPAGVVVAVLDGRGLLTPPPEPAVVYNPVVYG